MVCRRAEQISKSRSPVKSVTQTSLGSPSVLPRLAQLYPVRVSGSVRRQTSACARVSETSPSLHDDRRSLAWV